MAESGTTVETIVLRQGLTLVLSRLEGDECRYHHVEPEDVFGIGFHLKGGSRFDMGAKQFATRPLEVWAAAAPRGSASSFVLPAHGFHTVSIRFSPDVAYELFARNGADGLAALAGQADRETTVARLAPLDSAAAQQVEAMFATPYFGAARALLLEACALGLIAAQLASGACHAGGAALTASLPHRGRMLAARDWLDAHLADPPTIALLARIAGTNEFTLKRGFKESFGTTVFGYVRQRRMERAAAGLHAGQSVSQAAAEVGYECPRCFADAFRRHFGVLPSAVTRRVLAAIPAYHS